jgi:hypothetical protein
MMREVYKSIAGIVFLLGLVQVFNTFIKVYVAELMFVTASLNGIVFVTALMGLVIVAKTVVDTFYKRRKSSTFQE